MWKGGDKKWGGGQTKKQQITEKINQKKWKKRVNENNFSKFDSNKDRWEGRKKKKKQKPREREKGMKK